MGKSLRSKIAVDSNMTPRQVVDWLIEFGSDWVNSLNLSNTWADKELFWLGCAENGWLEHECRPTKYGAPEYYKLTPKALALVKEADHGR